MGAGHLHPSWEVEKSKVEKKGKKKVQLTSGLLI